MLRALVAAGFVEPARGARRTWRFSFQDLIVLRAAQSLVESHVPRRNITRALRELRKQLPASMPLSGLSIGAVGERVVVREGARRWQAESGQYLLAFDVEPAPPPVQDAVVVPDPELDADAAFDAALACEEAGDAAGALAGYGRAIEADAAHLDAHLNRALLLQAEGKVADAERAYEKALAACGEAPALLYNLALLFEDTGRNAQAAGAYERAVRADPDFADAHYNLGLLYEKLGRTRDAIRHLARYRQLTK